MTVKYTDEAGNSIKDDKIIVKFYGDYLEIDPETIEGYTFEKSEGSLKVTLVSDKTVTLIYTKDKTGGCGCGSDIRGGEVAVYAVVAACALVTGFLLKRKKDN